MNHHTIFNFDSQTITDIFLLLLGILSLVVTILILLLIIKAVKRYIRSSQSRAHRNTVKKNLGNILKEARTGKGFTQEFVAETIGISRQTLYKWEKGDSEPNLSFLSELSKLYDLDIETLLTASNFHTSE
ncbi:MAG: helix-turn-helix transcriptional regulator [Lachnospiraceae bacterium]|nr:helix-turn-helix transcriptional regulator [Lachnospiraceae bacterium]